MRFKVVFEPSEEGGYTVYVPALPDCTSERDTMDEAMENIREAVEIYFESLEDDWVLDEQAAVVEIELCAKCPVCLTRGSFRPYKEMAGQWCVSMEAICGSRKELDAREIHGCPGWQGDS